jgi:flagellar basal-body rod protein FlgB
MKIFDQTFSGLERAMDLQFKRHEILAGNAANSETPNYRARELDFSGELEKAFGEKNTPMTLTNSKHMDIGGEASDHVVFDNAGQVGADGNNVDLDITMGKISANAKGYDGASMLLSKKLMLMRAFIRPGRG